MAFFFVVNCSTLWPYIEVAGMTAEQDGQLILIIIWNDCTALWSREAAYCSYYSYETQ